VATPALTDAASPPLADVATPALTDAASPPLADDAPL
jgi:hypothetical protein